VPTVSTTPEPFYIGTYTAELEGHGRGIYLALRDRETGRLDVQGVAAELRSPTFLASHPVLPVLYVTSEAEGTVSAYRRNQAGDLELLNAQPTGGEMPCHVSVHPAGLFVFVANYGDGTFSAHGLAPDGRLSGQSHLVRHAGGGQDPVRQDGPHVHCTLPTPDGRYVLVTDLGADTVTSYPFDAASGALDQRAAHVAATSPGAGPRHLAFEPVSRLVYVSCELNSTVTVYTLADGRLRWLRARPATARTPAGLNFPSELLLDPAGRTLYVGNRGADVISAFAVGPGQLRALGNLPAGGQYPRHLALAGQHLYVGNQHSDTISIFALGPDGMPRLPGEQVAMPSPACLLPSSIN
jgi:6-phosphogluconolactonase